MTETPSPELVRSVADLLDRVLVREENGYEVQRKLKALAEEFADNESEEILTLVARAQGAVGMVNVSPHGNPLHEKALSDLSALKRELRSWSSAG